MCELVARKKFICGAFFLVIVIGLQASGCGHGASKGVAEKAPAIEKAPVNDRWSQGPFRSWAPDIFFDDPKVLDLCNAIADKDFDRIDRLVKIEGVDVNATGRRNVTPLFWAFPMGYVEAFVKLPRDEKGGLVGSEIAPTQRKYMGEHARLVEHLLKLGANPNIKTALANVVVVRNERKRVYLPGHIFESSQELAVTQIASQPLGCARFNYFPIVMANGGDPNLTNKNGMPLILYACGYLYNSMGGNSSPENVALLIDAGVDLEARDPNGRTPILLAATRTHFDVVYMLIHAGADFHAQEDSRGKEDLAWFVCRQMRAIESIPEKHREFDERGLRFAPCQIDPYFLEVVGFLAQESLQEDAYALWKDRIDQLVEQGEVVYGQRDPFIDEWVARGSYHAILAAGDDDGDRRPLNGPVQAEGLRLITQAEMESLASKRDPLGPAATWIRMGRDPASAREEAVRLQVQYAARAMASRKNSEWTLVPPELSARDKERLAEIVSAVESRSNVDVEVAVDPLAIYQIRSQVLTDLFPETTFVVVPWHTRKRPTSHASVVVPMFTASTFAIESDDGPAAEFPHSGHYEQFGDYLKDHHVVIRHHEEAAKIWKAFCAIHNKQWSNLRCLHLGNSWRLTWDAKIQGWDSEVPSGFVRIERYYELVVDREGRVQEGRLHAKEIRPARTGPGGP